MEIDTLITPVLRNVDANFGSSLLCFQLEARIIYRLAELYRIEQDQFVALRNQKMFRIFPFFL